MTSILALQDTLDPGSRFALDACVLAFGPLQGPVLLVANEPSWEHALRLRLSEHLFSVDASARPHAQAWVGAIWLEPRRDTWRAELSQISRELPGGALLSIMLSLPLSLFTSGANRQALGTTPLGLLQLRGALIAYGFRVDRSFGFHTLWWGVVRRIALRLQPQRPDLSDRLQYLMRRIFATRRLGLPFTTFGLIEARARMGPLWRV